MSTIIEVGKHEKAFTIRSADETAEAEVRVEFVNGRLEITIYETENVDVTFGGLTINGRQSTPPAESR